MEKRFFDEAFKLAQIAYKKDEVPSIPTEFSEMKQIASDLSSGFPFVRVDLFLINDGVVRVERILVRKDHQGVFIA